MAGTPEAGGWRSALHSAAGSSLLAPAAVSAYAITGAFWNTLLVGAHGQNCAIASRDPWEGVAILAGLLCIGLVVGGCVVAFAMRMRRDGLQLLLSGVLLLLSVALLVLVAASAGYLSCP